MPTSATLERLTLYVGALALFAIAGLHVWDQLRLDTASDPPDQPGFALASRSRAAFAVGLPDPSEKSDSYEMLRHSAGDRKDIFRWGPPDKKPMTELEIYRPDADFDPSQPRTAELAGRMAGEDRRELEAADVIDSKFGMVALYRRPGRFKPAKSCLGFLRHFDHPALQISGWSCEGASLPARRAAIACMLERLTLLASGNEPGLAALFARADLKRNGCGTTTAVSADWVTAAENPRLRGPLESVPAKGLVFMQLFRARPLYYGRLWPV